MFENLSDKFQDVFRRLRGQTTISESNIAESMQEVRDALIDADVNIEVADGFVNEVRQACLGESVVRSVTPASRP